MGRLEDMIKQSAEQTFTKHVAATKRKIDFSFDASLSWPVEEWYDPETGREQAAQKVIKDRRKQGLTDRITGGVVERIAGLIRK